MLARIVSPDILALGDRLAALTADKAAQLNLYLAQVHGIQPIAGVAVSSEPDIIVNDEQVEVAWNVVLERVDPAKRITLMKLLREKLGLSLLQARNLVESAPQTVRENVTQSEAEALQAQLEAAGAKVTLRAASF